MTLKSFIAQKDSDKETSSLKNRLNLYDNEYTLIIDIYFYETFSTFNPRALAL